MTSTSWIEQLHVLAIDSLIPELAPHLFLLEADVGGNHWSRLYWSGLRRLVREILA